MKKAILFTLLATFSLAIFAQQHLTFKGVPIDGTLQQYTEAMKGKGFTHAGTQDGISLLEGEFAGYKNCVIAVSTLKNLDVVSTIAVMFPEKSTWSALMNDYENLKDLLTEKYGNASEGVEKFTGLHPDFDEEKLDALRAGECSWYTIFSTKLGYIELTIISTGVDKGSAVLRYHDKVNGEKARQNAIDDL